MNMRRVVVEFKYRKLTRPLLDQIVGNAFRNRLTPPSDIVIKCHSASSTVYKAVDDYKVNRDVNVHIDTCLSEYDEE